MKVEGLEDQEIWQEDETVTSFLVTSFEYIRENY